MNFYAALANVQGHVLWCISSVWKNGINPRSRKIKSKVLLTIIFRNFTVRSVKTSILSTSKEGKKYMNSCLSKFQKGNTSYWRRSRSRTHA